MQTLNEISQRYLDENGIKYKYFAEYVGIGHAKCTRWLKGENNLNSKQIQKVHEFLSGGFLKSIEDIMNEGE